MTRKIKALFVSVVRDGWGNLTEVKIEAYEKDVHLAEAHKFLLLSTVRSDVAEDLLVVGGRDSLTSYHRNLRETFAKYYEFRFEKSFLQGAGNIEKCQVTSWESRGFRLYTSKTLHQPILEVLGLA